MFNRFVIPIVACIVATMAMWIVVEKTRPVFRTAAIETEGKSKGGMTGEMMQEYRFEVLKCDMVSFGIWGAVMAGFTGLAGNPAASSRWRGLVAGLILGAGAGALGAYLGQTQEAMIEYQGASSTYWIFRWAAIMLPIAVAASIACSLSGSVTRQLVECLAGGMLGLVIGVTVFSLLHGVATPLEKPSNVYPGWAANRILAMLAINLSVFTLILVQAGRCHTKQIPNAELGPTVEV